VLEESIFLLSHLCDVTPMSKELKARTTVRKPGHKTQTGQWARCIYATKCWPERHGLCSPTISLLSINNRVFRKYGIRWGQDTTLFLR